MLKYSQKDPNHSASGPESLLLHSPHQYILPWPYLLFLNIGHFQEQSTEAAEKQPVPILKTINIS